MGPCHLAHPVSGASWWKTKQKQKKNEAELSQPEMQPGVSIWFEIE